VTRVGVTEPVDAPVDARPSGGSASSGGSTHGGSAHPYIAGSLGGGVGEGKRLGERGASSSGSLRPFFFLPAKNRNTHDDAIGQRRRGLEKLEKMERDVTIIQQTSAHNSNFASKFISTKNFQPQTLYFCKIIYQQKNNFKKVICKIWKGGFSPQPYYVTTINGI